MKSLIIIEGDTPEIPSPSVFDNSSNIYLLFLSPRIKAYQYKEKISSSIKRKVDIEIINPRRLVDFDSSRQKLLDLIASLPQCLKIGNSTLSEYLTIQGLNMWWTSGIVEATPYKSNLFQNYYFLSAARKALEEFKIDEVWFRLDDLSLEKDLKSMLDSGGVEYYQKPKGILYARSLATYVQSAGKQAVAFFAEIASSILFKLICPGWVRPRESQTGGRSIHLFYSVYPHNWHLKDGVHEHKIYRDLPSVLSKSLGGEAYFLSASSLRFKLNPYRMIRDLRGFWRENIRFVPIGTFLSLWDIMRAFLSPARHWKYFCLRRANGYGEIFHLGKIDMFHTFDKIMRDSLLGHEAIANLLHYHAFRRLGRDCSKSIFQIIYYLEFHSWEVALICGVRDGGNSVPLVGLQQSAPNPTLLSFFFSPATFDDERNPYPLPDLILCSGKLYADLMYSNGIDPKRIEVVGFIAGQDLKQPVLSNGLRRKERGRLNLPPNTKICLVTCSTKLSLTEGIIYMVKQIASQLPRVFFAIKGHPDSPVGPLLAKYGLNKLPNIKEVDHPVSNLLALSDYFLSTGTSVSQEALWYGLPQVNLDIGGLPQANPLHMVPGLVRDVETLDELMEFFTDTERFRPPREKQHQFLGDLEIDPCQNISEVLVARFHRLAQ